MNDQERFDDLFAADEDSSSPVDEGRGEKWKILVVDDDKDVHTLARLALDGFTFDDKPLHILGARSFAEGKLVLTEHADIAMVLLDVVMESNTAGLRLVDYVRKTLANRSVRLVLRTGYPGEAPEREVVVAHDIDGYVAKTELTADRLFSLVISSLRAYKTIIALESHRHGLERLMAEKTAELHAVNRKLLAESEERRAAEEKLAKSNRLCAVLSQVNQAISRAQNTQELFQEICDIAIEYGQFRLAWIGVVDEERRVVRPVAFCGEDSDYLKDIDISLTDKVTGNGPTGRSIREKRSVAFNDLETNPDFEPWRGEALKRGYRSCAAFPIRLKSSAIGALTVHAFETHFFDEHEMHLLEEAALNISFALEKFGEEENRRQAEAALAEANTIISRSPVVAFLWKNEEGWPVEFVSENVEKLLGYSAEEFMEGNISYSELIHREDFDRVGREATEYSKRLGLLSFEHKPYRVLAKSGDTKWISDMTYVRKNARGIITHHEGIVCDITQRKRAEMIQIAQYNIAEAMTRAVNLETLFATIKSELAEVVDVRDIMLDLSEGGTMIDRVIQQEKSVILLREEIKALIEKGEITRVGPLPEAWLGVPLFSGATVIGAIIIENYENSGAFDEPTVQMLEVICHGLGGFVRHAQIEAERERLSAAIEQSAETVVITDTEGSISYVNPAFERTTGYTRLEVLGRRPESSGEHNEAFYRELWDTIKSGRVWQGKIINRRKDGGLFTEECTISPVFDGAGEIANYVAVKRDVTRELDLERQVRQSQKMESVGRLAGGVAHDFNNMLSVIIGYSELALAKLEATDELHSDIVEIKEAARRSAELTSQLLTFSRKQPISPRALDLNEVIGTMLKMMRRLIGEDINLTWAPANNLGTVLIDPAQIDQILANLCVNARDAIDDTGEVIIETRLVTFDDAYCETHTYVSPGEHIMLTVSDDGCGMDEETLSRIFEPFFTTKSPGKGTGLGLSTVYGIVKQNGGSINVYSEPGGGTSYKIYFPRYDAVDSAAPAEKETRPAAGRGQLIMLVEDETAILKLVETMLASIGYRVIATGTPREALRLVERQGDKIDLLVTDVVMSGYTANVIAHRAVLDEGVNFLTKPFTKHELAAKLDEALSGNMVE